MECGLRFQVEGWRVGALGCRVWWLAGDAWKDEGLEFVQGLGIRV